MIQPERSRSNWLDLKGTAHQVFPGRNSGLQGIHGKDVGRHGVRSAGHTGIPYRHLVTAVVLFLTVLATAPRATAADRLCDASFENCRTPLLNLIQTEQVGIDVAFWFM